MYRDEKDRDDGHTGGGGGGGGNRVGAGGAASSMPSPPASLLWSSSSSPPSSLLASFPRQRSVSSSSYSSVPYSSSLSRLLVPPRTMQSTTGQRPHSRTRRRDDYSTFYIGEDVHESTTTTRMTRSASASASATYSTVSRVRRARRALNADENDEDDDADGSSAAVVEETRSLLSRSLPSSSTSVAGGEGGGGGIGAELGERGRQRHLSSSSQDQCRHHQSVRSMTTGSVRDDSNPYVLLLLPPKTSASLAKLSSWSGAGDVGAGSGGGGGDIIRSAPASARNTPRHSPESSPLMGGGGGGGGGRGRQRQQQPQRQGSDRSIGLVRTHSNPFLRKPLALARSSGSLVSGLEGADGGGGGSIRSAPASARTTPRHSPESSPLLEGSTGRKISLVGLGGMMHHPNHHDEYRSAPIDSSIHRHLTFLDLLAVGVGGTLGSGVFVLVGVVTSSYAGPSSVLCWMAASIPALISGLCYAELAGQIPAAGSAYAYVYASMGELPALIAAACLCLEYLVSASAIARGWGEKIAEYYWSSVPAMAIEEAGRDDGMFGGGGGGGGIIDNDGAVAPSSFDGSHVRDEDFVHWLLRHVMRPGWTFNPMSCVLCIAISAILFNGAKESKAVTNRFATCTAAFVMLLTALGFGLFRRTNALMPFVPPRFGPGGILRGASVSFFGYVGFDEVCCLTAEVVNPRTDVPRAILYTIGILTVCYTAATAALVGMQPFEEIDPSAPFPSAFRSRGWGWASTLAALGGIASLPLVVLVAVMAQPRLQYALASDGLIPSWFGRLDNNGNLRNGTAFAGLVMTAIASFVPFDWLNGTVSAGVLVAFSMTNSSLLLLRHESPPDRPRLLGTLVASFNCLALVTSLLLVRCYDSASSPKAAVASITGTGAVERAVGPALTWLSLGLAVATCVMIKLRCPPAAHFGGETKRLTTQHVAVGVVSVSDEEFRTPLLPFLPCIGIFANWYLVAQSSWNGLCMLAIFLACSIAFYFSYGYYYSVGNNGGWEAYEWHDEDDVTIHGTEALLPEGRRAGRERARGGPRERMRNEEREDEEEVGMSLTLDRFGDVSDISLGVERTGMRDNIERDISFLSLME